ncbi:cuticle protein 16.5-like [Episyrphus balteatus]|uniref:cuticle protein 16.5-like n=1 Tax=Episyrphus balteatus TaxID=286459 RepID=UPI002485E2DE|nr:cuticle protein 16.5-like [Episyrphus balteatus]
MFKYTIVILAVIACAAAKPGLLAPSPLAYSSPLIAAAPGVVTATSSQVIARNYNGIASAPLLAAAAPVVAAPFAARYLASPYAAAAAAAPLIAAAPFAANYLASPYTAAPLGYSAPLTAAPLGYASAYGYASPLRYAASAPVLL